MLQKKLIIADRLLMLVLNLFFVLKETVAEFYQSANRWGKGFKMIAENGGESIVQDCEEAEFSVRQLNIYKNHKVYTLNHIIKK
jgi:two-component system chemotaxis response regulator CheB